jgi:signal peptide peptidase SppA
MSLFNPKSWFDRSPIVPVLRLSGVIGNSSPFSPALNLASLAEQIERTFEVKNAKAVALQINSPGGSPVQSKLIFNRIRALAKEKEIPVYSFVEDVAASGGYWLCLAGDEVYADDSSILGSIGVISSGFGFDKAIEKIGVERRVYTAGERKMSLDPFQPEQPEEIKRLKALQKEIHTAFRSLVEDRRGDKIAKAGDMLFTGEFWAGTKALELGLIDGLGDLRSVMREKLGDKVRLKLIRPKRGLFSRAGMGSRLNLQLDAQTITSGLTADLLHTLENRAHWSRFGL